MNKEDCAKTYHTDPCGGGCWTPIDKDARIAELEAQLGVALDDLKWIAWTPHYMGKPRVKNGSACEDRARKAISPDSIQRAVKRREREQEVLKIAKLVNDSIDAATYEGLYQALALTSDSVLQDLIQRRVLHYRNELSVAVSALESEGERG